MIDVYTMMQRSLSGKHPFKDGRLSVRRLKSRGREPSSRMTASLPNDIEAKIKWETQRELNRGTVRTLNDMTEDEIRALEERYGCQVKRNTNSIQDAPSETIVAPPAESRLDTPKPSEETAVKDLL